jgi:hypothetical protein
MIAASRFVSWVIDLTSQLWHNPSNPIKGDDGDE